MKRHRSKSETIFAKHLREQKVHSRYESVNIPYVVKRTKIYKPDFPVKHPGGGFVYLEVKGWFKGSDRVKLLKVIESNPGIDLRLIFEKDNWISTKKLQRYSDWAKKHHIAFTVGLKLPEAWLVELKKKSKN